MKVCQNSIFRVGKPGAKDTLHMLRSLQRPFIPDIDSPVLDKRAGYSKGYASVDGKATAYVCSDYVCSLPTTDDDQMIEQPGRGYIYP
jgi:uncharacterized protein YyaL (SSP411 family)